MVAKPPRSALKWMLDDASAPPSVFEDDPADMGTAFGLDCSLAQQVAPRGVIDDDDFDALLGTD
jgi:hypothetical protein